MPPSTARTPTNRIKPITPPEDEWQGRYQESGPRSGRRDLKVDTDFKRSAEDDPDELTPDSMSSRLLDSAVTHGLDDRLMRGDTVGDLVFDRMSSRIAE